MRLLLLSLFVFVSFSSPAKETGNGSLNWLVGCWVSPDNSEQEVWVADDEGALFGFSVAVQGSAVAFYEVMTIRNRNGAGWTFTAYPAGLGDLENIRSSGSPT